jgi:hypothetical protein
MGEDRRVGPEADTRPSAWPTLEAERRPSQRDGSDRHYELIVGVARPNPGLLLTISSHDQLCIELKVRAVEEIYDKWADRVCIPGIAAG